MSVREELRRRRLDEPDLDAEQEVDVREAWGKIARRWWLPAAGLALGIAVGFLLSLGGGAFYRAEALIYLGQPFGPGGAAPIPGLPISALRGNISTQEVISTGRVRVPNQVPLYEIAVEGDAPGRVAEAANVLAARVLSATSEYANVKIAGYEERLDALEQALASLNRRVDSLNAVLAAQRDLGSLERLELISQLDNAEQRREGLIADRTANRQLLALAESYERARVVTPAVAKKTTARSTRNSALVGGLIGLILGTLAALFADRFSGRASRRLA